ncbi:MAG: DUF937 domain-containing protein [Pseudomonadota bacterium]
MTLLETLLKGAGSSALTEIAKNFNLDGDQASAVVKQLAPVLARGITKNTQDASGLEGLMKALQSGNHERYLDDPSRLATEQGIQDGNGILGHLLGSKDVSREVAKRAAASTGVSDGIIKQMLPMVAGMVMGSLRKQQRSEPNFADALNGGSSTGAAGGLLASFLDADKDGSVVDDLLGLAGRLLRR